MAEEQGQEKRDASKGFAGLTSMVSNVETDVFNAAKAPKLICPLLHTTRLRIRQTLNNPYDKIDLFQMWG